MSTTFDDILLSQCSVYIVVYSARVMLFFIKLIKSFIYIEYYYFFIGAFLASERGGRKLRSGNCRRSKANVAETGEHIVFECNDGFRSSLRQRHIAGARTWEDLDRPRHKHKVGVGGAPAQDEEDLVETFFAGILRQIAEELDGEESEEEEVTEEVLVAGEDVVDEAQVAREDGVVAQAAGGEGGEFNAFLGVVK